MNVAALYIKGVQGICESEPALAQTIYEKGLFGCKPIDPAYPFLDR
jgi:hypothetical protein